jgi:hypothetical protein
MDANNFDQFTRALARRIPRRGLFALAGGLAALQGRGIARAQLAPSCGQAGAVCTMLSGCCEGFTCVTSTINVNYGVCAAGGTGGTVAGTSSLISPLADGAAQQVAGATTTDTSSTSTTDPQAEKQARIDQHKARKDAHRSQIQSRRNTQQTKRDDHKAQRQLNRAPQLDISLTLPSSNNGSDPEVVKVKNNTNDSVFISEIHRLKDETDRTSSNKTLNSGDAYFFLSGLPNGTTVHDDENLWLNQYVCADPEDGFVITAAQTSSSTNHEYTVLCDGTVSSDAGTVSNHHKHHNSHKPKHASPHKKGNAGKGKGRKGKQHKHQ